MELLDEALVQLPLPTRKEDPERGLEVLGHSSVSLTSRHYSGITEALKRQASDSLAALLSRSL